MFGGRRDAAAACNAGRPAEHDWRASESLSLRGLFLRDLRVFRVFVVSVSHLRL